MSAESNVSGPLNGCAPQPVTNVDFTRILAQAVHRPAFFAIPRFALNLALGEMSSFLFDSLRVTPTATQAAGFHFDHRDLAESLPQLVR